MNITVEHLRYWASKKVGKLPRMFGVRRLPRPTIHELVNMQGGVVVSEREAEKARLMAHFVRMRRKYGLGYVELVRRTLDSGRAGVRTVRTCNRIKWRVLRGMRREIEGGGRDEV